MSDRAKWVWMPHAGHFICGRSCRFHLNTYVGRFIVSTVGDLLFDEGSREITAQSKGIKLEGRGDERLADYMRKIGYEDIGAGRKYETMVFKAGKRDAKSCCQYTASDWSELDAEGYNTPEAATAGHLRLCLKWSKR